MSRTHRPCAWLGLTLAAGIAAGKCVHVPVWVWFGGWAFGTGLFFMRPCAGLLYAVLFCAGACHMVSAGRLAPDSVAFLTRVERTAVRGIEGIVVSPPTPMRGGVRAEMDVERLQGLYGWRPAGGKVQIQVPAGTPPAYGDRCRVAGRLLPFFEGNKGFSYRRYMREQGVFWMVRASKPGDCLILGHGHGHRAVALALRVRDGMTAVFRRYLDPAHASFVSALVLGEHNAMPRDVKQLFVNTGTAHILAISGMNMTIIAAVFFFLLKLCGLPRRAQFTGTMGFVFLYAFVTGWSPSVVRACLMSAVILAGFACEDEGEGLNSLGLAAVLLLAADPKALFDIGFQLSFAAVAAIMLFLKPCQRAFQALPPVLGTSMAVSLAAWAGTAPIIAYHFHMVTPVSIFANIPIVPLADLVMALGLGLAATGMWVPFLGNAFAALIKAALSAMIICAGWFDGIPGGHWGWPA